MTLDEFFAKHKKVALAFSGGVDSSYLLYAAKNSGCDIHPYYLKTAFQSQFEFEDAKKLADELDIKLTVIDFDVLKVIEVGRNEQYRCYHCKRALFGAVKEAALVDGYDTVVDGTNASDDDVERPGMRALAELGVRSPLRECGFTKPQIRELCRAAGLFIWDKPAYACLATRIPSGMTITEEQLEKVEQAEAFLMKMGFRDLRVRCFHGAAKIQLCKGQFERACSLREEILKGVSPLFNEVLLDMRARD